ncbi:MAG: hypothetical protein L0Z62_06850 [Gemmataceae bacterium]|nr:hypothetical protein [Gemmataceae bacterium]
MFLLTRLCLAAALLTTGESAEFAANAIRQAGEDEQLLRSAKLPTDGPGLVAFLRKQALTDGDAKRVEGLIRRLGDRNFKVRSQAEAELTSRGPGVLALLRRAVEQPDLELRRRVEQCIKTIERTPWAEVSAAAARRLKVLRPEGASAALLAYLPFTGDEAAEEAVTEAVFALGSAAGKEGAALSAALRDREPLRRAAAALALGARGNAGQRAAVREVMRADLSLQVRLRAAQGLLMAGEREGIPVLVNAVADGNPDLARLADDLLRRAAGETAPPEEHVEDGPARRRLAAAWRAWWQARGGQVNLAGTDFTPSASSPPLQARAVAGRFVNALLRGDGAAFQAATGVPFQFQGEKPIRTRQELKRFFEKEFKDPPKERVEVVSLRVQRLGGYEWGAVDDEERQFLRGLRGRGVQVVLVEVRTEGVREVISLFVRVVGLRAFVVGMGDGRERLDPSLGVRRTARSVGAAPS